MEQNQAQGLQKTFGVARIIGFALILSVFIYAGIIEAVKATGQMKVAGSAEEHNAVQKIVIIIAFCQFFLIRVIKKMLLSRGGEDGADRSSAYYGKVLLRTSIIELALCESIAIYGIVLFFLFKYSLDFYLPMLMSLAAFVYHFPRYSRWEEWVKEKMRGEQDVQDAAISEGK